MSVTPGVARIFTRRGRSLDPIWAIVFLLAVNRLSFYIRVSAPASHAMAAILALILAVTAWGYQRHDA